jgi:hypothetical protein
MDDNDTSWPRKEPENWRGLDLTRDEARALFDALDGDVVPTFLDALDEAQGSAQNGESVLLIRIVDRTS